VTSRNNVVLLAGLSTGTLRVAARTGTDNHALPSGVTLKSFGAIDGNGSAIFFLATLQGAGITGKNAAALCMALGDGSVKVQVQMAQIVGGKAIATIGTLVGSAGSLAEGRWRLDDTTIGVRLTFAGRRRERLRQQRQRRRLRDLHRRQARPTQASRAMKRASLAI
jgi:hypothetical protein